MNFQFLAIFLVCICIPSIYADDESLQSNKTKEGPSLSSKIQPILIQWQQAENQSEFAQINNIPTIDEKIKIYIYLDNKEMREKLPPEITVTGFDGNLVGALVTADDLYTLDKLDYIQKVTVPVLAQTPPIPQIENQDSDVYKDNKFDSTYWVFILVAVIFLAIIIIKKRKTLKTNPQKN